MKRISAYWLLLSVMIVASVILTRCYHNDRNSTDWMPDTPWLSTLNVTSVTLTTAISGGFIVWGGRAPITARGVCWSTSSNPSVIVGKTNEGSSGQASFTSKLTGLSANTKYNVWAYATNSHGTAGGGKKQFTTAPEVPVVTTSPVIYYTNTSAKTEGRITSQGLTPVTERGVFWSTSPNPEITGTKVLVGADTGKFSTNLMGLSPATKYYVKAFATNSVGTTYGEQVDFTTNLVYSLPFFLINPVIKLTLNSAECGGNIPYDGGSPITARGVCWSTLHDPTTADNKTTDSIGTGIFTSKLKDLTANTIYYIRTYAINNLGTAYSDMAIFRTRAGTINDVEGNTYYTQTIGTQVWMAANLRTRKFKDNTDIQFVPDNTAWASLLTTPAYCWYTNSVGGYVGTAGALYNWYAVNTGKVCPTGWHVPSDGEWTTLINSVGGQAIAGQKLKEPGTSHWMSPNAGTDESGFTALPGGWRDPLQGGFFAGGYRNSMDGQFYNDNDGTWWSTTISNGWAGIIMIGNKENKVARYTSPYKSGFSIRCVKD